MKPRSNFSARRSAGLIGLAAFSFSSLLFATPLRAQVPAEVQNLSWCAGSKDCLQWSASGGATQYHVYRGETASLPCILNAPLDSCLESIVAPATTGLGAIPEIPAPGRFYWFLVTPESAAGEGPSGDSNTAGTTQPRVRNTFGSCPSSCTAVAGGCLGASDCCSSNCAGTCLAACCAPAGATCGQPSDCCSSRCAGGLCQPCLALGQSCTTSATCCSGNCSAGTCVAPCEPSGGNCLTNQQCCSGEYCTAGLCQPCIADGGSCVSGSQCCGGTCTNNICQTPCGPNGSACVTGSQCCSGVCTSNQCAPLVCNPGFADCNNNPVDGCEVNLNTSPSNCGNCGLTCSPNNIPNPTCGNGVCNGACAAGFLDCDGNKQANGCEVNVATSATNCGGCGVVCSSNNVPNPTCASGTCNGACAIGFVDCDNNKQANGCEVNIETSPTNCGGCGAVCSSNNIPSPTCSSGTCNGACAAGFLDCDGNKRNNGCEINVSTDPTNCGGCGMVCSTNNIPTPTCGSGVCNGACATGFLDCDGNKRNNGCEINISADPTNCGGCGIVCSSNHIPTPTCGSGVCNGGCAAGFGDCDGNKQLNGCETPLNTNSNCGTCGHVCGTGQVCDSGTCIIP